MEPGRAAAEEVKMLAVVEGDARPEAVGGDGGAGEEKKTADGARKTAVETSVIGSPAVGPVVAATADVDGDESATGKGDAGDAAADGAAAVTVVADLVDQAEPSAALKVVADLIGAEASGDVCEVKDDMQMEVSALSVFFISINWSERQAWVHRWLRRKCRLSHIDSFKCFHTICSYTPMIRVGFSI
jgi:hypothetical protein